MNKFRIHCQLEYSVTEATEFIFQIEAAQHDWQTIVHENISITAEHWHLQHFQRDHGLNRLIRLSALAEHQIKLQYNADVTLHIPARPISADEHAIANLPSETLFYLAPSRFCESDLLTAMAQRTFGQLPSGYQRVQAICDWIHTHIIYESGASDSTTTAKDILVNRAGVCRDFAHLAIAICRALNIPARFVVGYMPFYKALPDFHAIFEVYLGGQWVLFDATQMGPIDQFVRIGTGLDAKDVPFASLFGAAELIQIKPEIEAV